LQVSIIISLFTNIIGCVSVMWLRADERYWSILTIH